MSSFPKQLLANPSGFPDFGPAEAIALQKVTDVIRKHFELAGYAPLETPLVERPEVLFAKAEGEIKTQAYGLRLLNPAGDADDAKDLALRYDLTVPLARYVATHYSELAFPFRRYAIGPVFRGERAKDGRYRQFIQADIDAIGENTLSPLHEAEMVATIVNIFKELGIGGFVVRIGHRKVLQGLLENAGLSSEAVPAAFREIDRLEKVGANEVARALTELGMDAQKVSALLVFIGAKNSNEKVLASLRGDGRTELEGLISAIRGLGVTDENFRIDLSIVRGLDYYTGIVFETELIGNSDIGTIAAGGRYDDLAGAFINRTLPGVGISIGVTRLATKLMKAGVLHTTAQTPAKVLITMAEPALSTTYLEWATLLRGVGIAVESYFGDKPIGKQLELAEKRGIPLAIVADADHIKREMASLRNIKTGEKQEVVIQELVEDVVRALRA